MQKIRVITYKLNYQPAKTITKAKSAGLKQVFQLASWNTDNPVASVQNKVSRACVSEQSKAQLSVSTQL